MAGDHSVEAGIDSDMLPSSAHAMFPLMLDVTAVPIFLIGGSAGLEARFDAMVAYGAKDVHVFSAAPDGGFAARVGDQLQRRWPDDADFQRVRPRLTFIADVDDGLASSWRDMSHKVGGLVHVQDRIPLCDFHMPAILRRGRLQVTVSTDGTAPGLARILRDYLATRVFGAEWSARVEEMSKMRQRWKQDGLPLPKLSNAIHDFLRTRGWLDT